MLPLRITPKEGDMESGIILNSDKYNLRKEVKTV
jgi:hypothetical protein